MSRPKKIIRNLLIVAILLLLFLNRSGLYFSPLSAHEHSERSIHYGPSKVVHVENFDGGKYILSKYDKWVSCNTVNRSLVFFWRFGDQPIGFENDKTKPLDFTWSGSYQNYKVYGIINDNRVKKIGITLSDDEVLTQTNFYDGLFLVSWTNNQEFKNIKGYDSNGQVIFESEYE